MFEKIKKKYALNNSYFKNRLPNMPADPFEVVDYYLEHGELPYKGDMNKDWFYECFIEYQKRAGVQNSQFFTPPKTAERIAEIVSDYVELDERILDACCGFGQLAIALSNKGFTQIKAFDNDKRFSEFCDNFTTVETRCFDYNNDEDYAMIFGRRFRVIVANPPYEIKELTNFLYFVRKHLYENGIAILLLPSNFIDKQRPKRLTQILYQFDILHREPMKEDFARTAIKAEIVVLKANSIGE